MSNLRITVSEKVLRKARIKALKEGTSVNALLRSFLEHYVRDVSPRKTGIEHILALSRSSRAASGGKRWTRNELHERGA